MFTFYYILSINLNKIKILSVSPSVVCFLWIPVPFGQEPLNSARGRDFLSG